MSSVVVTWSSSDILFSVRGGMMPKYESKDGREIVEQDWTKFRNGSYTWNNENQVVCNSGVLHVHL